MDSVVMVDLLLLYFYKRKLKHCFLIGFFKLSKNK